MFAMQESELTDRSAASQDMHEENYDEDDTEDDYATKQVNSLNDNGQCNIG